MDYMKRIQEKLRQAKPHELRMILRVLENVIPERREDKKED